MADFKTGFLIPRAGIVSEIRRVIDRSEREFVKGSSGSGLGFLWEHSLQVAAITYQLADMEKIDPLVPTLAALLHDSGKFPDGAYHGDDIPEEEHAAKTAEQVLNRLQLESYLITDVVAAITALYNEQGGDNRSADLIHDADFLAKFGFMGAASLFMKNTLRGRNLELTVINTFSKELTYAGVLQDNMRTDAGRILALEKSSNSRIFFTGLLKELSQHGIAHYRILEKVLPAELTKTRKLKVCLVLPPACGRCGHEPELEHQVQQGVKCKKLVTTYTCPKCDEVVQFSFCLPEVTGPRL